MSATLFPTELPSRNSWNMNLETYNSRWYLIVIFENLNLRCRFQVLSFKYFGCGGGIFSSSRYWRDFVVLGSAECCASSHSSTLVCALRACLASARANPSCYCLFLWMFQVPSFKLQVLWLRGWDFPSGLGFSVSLRSTWKNPANPNATQSIVSLPSICLIIQLIFYKLSINN